MLFDSVQIGVDDVRHTTQAYALLLGMWPAGMTEGAQRFQLGRGAVEIESGTLGLHAMRFIPAAEQGTTQMVAEAFFGLDVRCGEAVETVQPAEATNECVAGIDHVVIHTPNLDRAIRLWRDRLGLRLALDREFPARGLRMAFFRSAGVTLEFVSAVGSAPDASGPDRFYGIAYRVRSLETHRSRLLAAGLDVSAIRKGNKPGTLVATVRSGTAGVPTLFIEDASHPRDAYS